MIAVKFVLVAALSTLAACSQQQTTANETADQLDNAATQSDPAAAISLHNDAEAVRQSGVSVGNASDPDGTIQNAMENAGDAQANTVAR